MPSSTIPIPVDASERAPFLDILRGIALLCILVMNGFSFSMLSYLPPATIEKFPTYFLDLPLMGAAFIMVDGKFYSLFSLLFGIGFAITLIRNELRGNNPLRIFYRRLLILLAIGLAHLLLLWEGDILFLYALIGMLLPLFRKWSDKTLLTLAIVLILLPIPIDILRTLIQWSPGDALFAIGQQLDKKNGIPTTPPDYAFYLSNPRSSYAEILNWCQSGFFYRYQYILDSNRIPKVLGLFLIGFYVGRKQLYTRLNEIRPLLKRILIWGLVIGLPLNVGRAIFLIDEYSVPKSWMGMADTVTYALGVVPLSLAYAAGLALLWNKNRQHNWLNKLSPVGRMALTNYLMQTILSLLVFTNLGLGLGGKVGYSVVFGFVVVIWLIQILYSTLWLRYFHYGPMEWLWRQLTYGTRLPLTKNKPINSSAHI